MDLGGWLRGLGLEQYEAVFRQNEINEKVLPSLTAEDLKELGVAALGQRRMLPDAIALLRADAVAKTTPAEGVPTLFKTAQDSAERRQVTVMLSDLVGSTALSARMEPPRTHANSFRLIRNARRDVQRFGVYPPSTE